MVFWESYVAGYDPADPASIFAITGIEVIGGAAHLTWTPPARSDRAYTILGKAFLSDPDWLPTNQVPNARFFKLQVK